MSNSDFDRNKQPTFGPFGPTSVDPRAPVASTQIEPIRVTPQPGINSVVGQPMVDIPPSRPSPAVKPGR